MKNIFLFEILLVRLCYSFKYVPLQYFEFGGAFDIEIYFGQSTSGEMFDMDLSGQFLWVTNTDYLTGEDPTIKFIEDEEIAIFNDMHNSKKCQTHFSFGHDKKIWNVPYYQVDGTKISKFDCFPLAPKYKDESFSFIHQLYNQKVIEKKAFGIAISFPLEKEGILYLGGFPEEALQNFTYQKSCHVDSSRYDWSCKLRYVEINEKSYENNDYMTFQTTVEDILVPKKFHEYFAHEILGDEINNKICNYTEDESISCYCNSLEEKNILVTFIIDDVPIKLEKEYLYTPYDDICIFLLVPNTESINTWVLGYNFLRKYPMEYNLEKETITFYRMSPFPSSRHIQEKGQLKKFALFGNIAILSASLVLLLLQLIKIK